MGLHGAALDCGDRADDHDAPCGFVFDHQLRRLLRAEESGFQIRLLGAVPDVLRHLVPFVERADAGVVHQHVDAAVALADFLKHAVDFGNFREIADHQFRLVSGGADGIERAPGSGVFRAGVDKREVALRRQTFGDGGTDAAGRARDEGDRQRLG